MSDNYEYNSQDYIADKILVESGGVGSYEAKIRMKFYERGDIENATRFKHGLGYKDPDPEGTKGCYRFAVVMFIISIIAIIVGYSCMDSNHSFAFLALAGIAGVIFFGMGVFNV